ncbi:MAG: glycosyltransferase family 2 protein [Nitrospirae bacterium]|nr:glycosyltransferase family 2 protein [Nitrospirota bacterium]
MTKPDEQGKPRVSVIITSYNYGRYLAEAVESVVAQTCRDYEIIIVDDGSTDDTPEVADALKARYPSHRIKVVTQQNQGLSGARNAGIWEAAGEYIQPLDADDMLAPDYLEVTVKALDEDPGVSFVYTAPYYFGELACRHKGGGPDREFSLDRLINTNILSICAMFRKGAWEDVGGFKLRGRHTGYYDWEFWLSLAEAGHTGRFIDRPLYMYRRHEGSEVAGAMLRHREITYWIRGQHLRLYYPGQYRVHPGLARWMNWLKFAVKDPLSHHVYKEYPAVHMAFKKLLAGAGLLKAKRNR